MSNEFHGSDDTRDNKDDRNSGGDQGIIHHLNSEEQKQTAAHYQHRPQYQPPPIFIVRLWQRLYSWWTDPYRPRGNFSEHLTVVASIIIAVIAAFQWNVYRQQKHIMEQQKTIMESSGHQTNQLIDAAELQVGASLRIADASGTEAHAADRNADAAASFAQSAGGINTKTGEAVTQFRALSDATARAAEAAKSAADAAHESADTLLASERGWIKIADFEAGSEFWYTPTEYFQLTTNYRLVNVGHSVITSIHVDAQMIAEYWGKTMLQDVIDKETSWCNEKRKERPDPRELRTLFPGDDFSSDITVSIGKQEMYEADRTWPNPYGDREKEVIPVIIGCVSYRLPFSDDMHQTRFAYNVNFIDPTKPLIPKSNLHGQNRFVIGRTVPQSQIDIRPHYFGGLYAD